MKQIQKSIKYRFVYKNGSFSPNLVRISNGTHIDLFFKDIDLNSSVINISNTDSNVWSRNSPCRGHKLKTKGPKQIRLGPFVFLHSHY
jgi:hypothetical protein